MGRDANSVASMDMNRGGPKCLKTRPKVTARGELRRTVVETQKSAESLPATNESVGRLWL